MTKPIGLGLVGTSPGTDLKVRHLFLTENHGTTLYGVHHKHSHMPAALPDGQRPNTGFPWPWAASSAPRWRLDYQ